MIKNNNIKLMLICFIVLSLYNILLEKKNALGDLIKSSVDLKWCVDLSKRSNWLSWLWWGDLVYVKSTWDLAIPTVEIYLF